MTSQRPLRTHRTSKEGSRGPVKATHPFSDSYVSLARSHSSTTVGLPKRPPGASPERRAPQSTAAVSLPGKDTKSSLGWKTPPNLITSPNPKRSTSLGSLPDADTNYLNAQWPKVPCHPHQAAAGEQDSSVIPEKVSPKIHHRRSNSTGTFGHQQKSAQVSTAKSGRSSVPLSPGTTTYCYQSPGAIEIKMGSSRRSLEGLNQEVSTSFEGYELGSSPKQYTLDGHKPGLVDHLSRLSVGTQTPPMSLSPSSPTVSSSPRVGTQTTPTDIEVAMHSSQGVDYHRYPPSPKLVMGRGPPDGAEKPVMLEPVCGTKERLKRISTGPDLTKAKVIKFSPGSGFSTPINHLTTRMS